MKKKELKVGDLVRDWVDFHLPGDKWLGMVIYPPGSIFGFSKRWVCVATVAGSSAPTLPHERDDEQEHLFWVRAAHLDVVASGQEG